MNKIAKASVAGAAGVILLMGGAGSLAYWNNSQSLGSGGATVTAGQLLASPVANTAPWTVAFVNAAGTTTSTSSALTPTQVGAYRIVPGDKITFSQTFTVSATGNDLLFKVGVTNPTLDSTNKLAAHLVVAGAAVVQNSSGTTVTPNGNGSYTAAAGVSKIVVTQTFTWAFGSAPADNVSGDNDSNTSSGATYTLPTTGVVTLTQVDS